jgi:hypothetical protein
VKGFRLRILAASRPSWALDPVVWYACLVGWDPALLTSWDLQQRADAEAGIFYMGG